MSCSFSALHSAVQIAVCQTQVWRSQGWQVRQGSFFVSCALVSDVLRIRPRLLRGRLPVRGRACLKKSLVSALSAEARMARARRARRARKARGRMPWQKAPQREDPPDAINHSPLGRGACLRCCPCCPGRASDGFPVQKSRAEVHAAVTSANARCLSRHPRCHSTPQSTASLRRARSGQVAPAPVEAPAAAAPAAAAAATDGAAPADPAATVC